MTDEPSDRDLWEQAGAGSGEAFGLLSDRHSHTVYNHCFRLTASWATAEDLTSATFLVAWRQRDRMRLANDSLRPWLLAVATNTVRSERPSVAPVAAARPATPYGRLVWAVNRTVVLVCEFDPADRGGPMAVISRLGTGPMAYLPARGAPVTASCNSVGGVRADGRPPAWGWPVHGRVRADVARLTLTEPGSAPVGVSIDGPYYVTRMIQRREGPFSPTITAYDKAGHVLGTAG